jgi:hypothetical protein
MGPLAAGGIVGALPVLIFAFLVRRPSSAA